MILKRGTVNVHIYVKYLFYCFNSQWTEQLFHTQGRVWRISLSHLYSSVYEMGLKQIGARQIQSKLLNLLWFKLWLLFDTLVNQMRLLKFTLVFTQGGIYSSFHWQVGNLWEKSISTIKLEFLWLGFQWEQLNVCNLAYQRAVYLWNSLPHKAVGIKSQSAKDG